MLAVVKDISEKEGVVCVWLYFYWVVLCAFEKISMNSELTGFRESVSNMC